MASKKDIPLKDGFESLNRSYVGEIIDYGHAVYDRSGEPTDSYKVTLKCPDNRAPGGFRETDVWGVALEDLIKNDENGPYNKGDYIAISHIGHEIANVGGKSSTLKRNAFNIEKIPEEHLDKAVAHYRETDDNYHRIARKGLGPSGVETFVAEENGEKVVSLADMTLEDFNQARGATNRPVTMQEKNEFEEQKQEFLHEEKGEPTLEKFADKYGYEIKENSALDNEEAKSLKIIPQSTVLKERNEELKKASGKSYKSGYNKAVDNDDNPAMKNGKERPIVQQLTGGAVVANFIGKGVKNTYEAVSSIDVGNPADLVRGIRDGWKNYTSEKAMQEAFTRTVNQTPLQNELFKKQIDAEIINSFEERLKNIDKGLDVREADKVFVDKADKLLAMDSMNNPEFKKRLNQTLLHGDEMLKNTPANMQADVKLQMQNNIRDLYMGEVGENNVYNPKYGQNAARMSSMDKALDTEIGLAYEERLKSIKDGQDVRLADQAFNDRMKKAFGISGDNLEFDQALSDSLIRHDKSRKAVDDPDYTKQFKENLNEIKQNFVKESEIFEVIAQNHAIDSIGKENNTPNPYEGLYESRASKANLESFDKKDDNEKLLGKLGEKIGGIASSIAQFLARISGPKGSNPGPSGP